MSLVVLSADWQLWEHVHTRVFGAANLAWYFEFESLFKGKFNVVALKSPTPAVLCEPASQLYNIIDYIFT